MFDATTILTEGDVEFTIYAADLEHLDTAVELLKKKHQYTASQRLAYIREFLTSHLSDAS